MLSPHHLSCKTLWQHGLRFHYKCHGTLWFRRKRWYCEHDWIQFFRRYRHTGTVIYQEYSNSKATCTDYLRTRRSFRAQFIDALSASATRHTLELKPEKRGMAWKRLRPFISRRMLNSLCYGFSVSVLRATVFGMVSFILLYSYYQTKLNCQLHPKKSISINCNGS